MRKFNFISDIQPLKNDILSGEIIEHLNDLTKPQGSLGRLEELALRYCLCRGSADAKITHMRVCTFAADHGITQERITPFPSEVTAQMVMNMLSGGAAVSVMCSEAGIEYTVIDMGVDSLFKPTPGLVDAKVARGTRNFSKEPAMTEAECEKAVQAGYDLGADSRYSLAGIGEMGIGNTSSASALYSLILGLDAHDTVGMGTGSAGALLEKKRTIVADAVSMHKKQWDGSACDALRRVGGFEIAAMAGFIFGAASKRVPVVVDGFIASAAALVAMRMQPLIRDYLFFAHVSAEKFHSSFCDAEGIKPLLTLEMRLGEGTGAVLAMQIIKQAIACYSSMATFSSARVTNKQ